MFLIYNYNRIISSHLNLSSSSLRLGLCKKLINQSSLLYFSSSSSSSSNNENVVDKKLTKIKLTKISNSNKNKPKSDLQKNEIISSIDNASIIHGKIETTSIDASGRQTSQLLTSLKSLSEKNFLFRIILNRPIMITEWINSSKEEKIDRFVYDFSSFTLIFAGFILINVCYLYWTIEKHEITDREYLNIVSKDVNDLYEELLLNELTEKYDDKFLPSSNEHIKLCDKILQNLIEKNKDYMDDSDVDTKWSTIIIDDNELIDSYTIYSNKFIILTKKLVDLCENDENQLAYVLAHLLSHGILKHYREPLSRLKLTQIWKEFKLLYFCRAMWFFQPSQFFHKNLPKDSFLVTYDEWARDKFYRKYHDLLKTLPISKDVEEETDRITMQLLSRSCYDIRQVKIFTEKCHQLHSGTQNELSYDQSKQYLYEHRYDKDEKLKQLNDENFMKKFLKFREECGCVPLL